MKLSKTMSEALAKIRESGGYIYRTAGGFWWPGDIKSTWYGASTVSALVKRGVLVYTEWKEGKNFRFPVRADIAPQKSGTGPVQATTAAAVNAAE